MVDFVGVRLLVGELGQMPPTIRAELRKGLKDAGQFALAKARANASWSTRIPAAMSLRTSTSASNAGVFIRVDSAKAPHARPYEGIGSRGDSFRHPVPGDRDVWVRQLTRPFLVPAVRDTRPKVTEAGINAVRVAAQHAGFR